MKEDDSAMREQQRIDALMVKRANGQSLGATVHIRSSSAVPTPKLQQQQQQHQQEGLGGIRCITERDEYEEKQRIQRAKWKEETVGAWKYWTNVGRAGGRGGAEYNQRQLPAAQEHQNHQPLVLEDPFLKIDELNRNDIIDVEAVQKREEESRLEQEAVQRSKQRKNEEDRIAIQYARKEEDRIQRERQERRHTEQVQRIQQQHQQQQQQQRSLPQQALVSFTGSLNEFDDLTVELDSIIGTIGALDEPELQDIEDQLVKLKRIREQERKRIEKELEHNRAKEEEQRQQVEDLRREEVRQKKKKLEELSAQRQQLILEQQTQVRETGSATRTPRIWNSHLNDKLDVLLDKIVQFSCNSYTQALGMDYVNAMREVSNAIDDVFPLLNEPDVKTVAGQMKELVVLSTEFVNSAKSKDRVKADKYRFCETKGELETLLTDIKRGIERSVREAVTEKKQDQKRVQLLACIREAAMEGVLAGEYLQKDQHETPLKQLQTAVTGLVQKSNEIAAHLNSHIISSQVLLSCGNVEIAMRKLIEFPNDGNYRAELITSIGAWLTVLQAVQLSFST